MNVFNKLLCSFSKVRDNQSRKNLDDFCEGCKNVINLWKQFHTKEHEKVIS
jgi:hypothetical protein